MDGQEKSIVDRLRQEGTCVIPLNQLKLPTTKQMMANAYALADRLDRPVELNKCEVGSAVEDLRECPEILLWALEQKLLNIVENYIGLTNLVSRFCGQTQYS